MGLFMVKFIIALSAVLLSGCEDPDYFDQKRCGKAMWKLGVYEKGYPRPHVTSWHNTEDECKFYAKEFEKPFTCSDYSYQCGGKHE